MVPHETETPQKEKRYGINLLCISKRSTPHHNKGQQLNPTFYKKFTYKYSKITLNLREL